MYRPTIIPIRLDASTERQVRGSVAPLATPLKLDLSRHAFIVDSPSLLPAGRVLRSINEDVLASYRVHDLCNNRRDVEEVMEFLEWSLSQLKIKIAKSPAYSAAYSGLHAVEQDNLSKVRLANGYAASSYLRDSVYPWAPPESCPMPMTLDSISSMVEWYNAVVAHHNLRSPASVFRPGQARPWPLLNYKKASSYGPLPYVPGSSHLSGASLIWHGYVAACAHKLYLTSPSSDWDSAFRVALSLATSSEYPSDLPTGCGMLLRRARPLKKNRSMPYWHSDSSSLQLSATFGENDTRSASRDIKALPAYVNMLYTDTSQWYSELYQHIPGLHAGHPSWTVDFLSNFSSLVGQRNVKFYVSDISAYDNSTCKSHLMHLAEFERVLFSDSGDSTIAYHDYISQVPVLTKGLFDRKASQFTVLRRNGGIASGFQGTTVQGTQNVTPMTITAISRITGWSFDQALRRSLNYQLSLSLVRSSSEPCLWGWLNKGDDLLLLTRSDLQISEVALQQAFSDLGYVLEFEPQPLFLMTALGYIPEGRTVTPTDLVKGHHYHSNMANVLYTGLVLKRCANRFLFAEHAVNHDVVWPIAMLGAFEHCDNHPMFAEVLNFSLGRLRRLYPFIHTLRQLRDYVASSTYKARLQSYSESVSSGSPYLAELARKYMASDGAWSTAAHQWDLGLIPDLVRTLKLPPLDPTGILKQYQGIQAADKGYTAQLDFGQSETDTPSKLGHSASSLYKHITSITKHANL